MERADIGELADAAMRLHGKCRALKLAYRYAANASAENDQFLFGRWAAVAALIAEHLELEARFGRQQV